MTKEYYLGLISGTSMDAVDAALVEFDPTPKLIATHSEPIPELLRQSLINLCIHGHNAINRMGSADIQLGRLFAESALTLLQKAKFSSRQIRAIGSHGQTIRHVPNTPFPFTLQIGDPNIIVTLTGITTVADFRRRDMALGGQAAPLAPAFHNVLLRNKNENRWVLNIGGIANLTYLPANNNQPVIGFDTGPGNTLLDAWCYHHLKKRLDHHGEWGASGNIDNDLLSLLLDDDYFHQAAPKSTGREYFNLAWLQQKLTTRKKTLVPQDVQATLTELSAVSIGRDIQSIKDAPGSVWICGGGVHNDYLLSRLKIHCPHFRMTNTEEIGIHPDWIEAVCFAWMARQTIRGEPGNLPSVTGASRATILGAIYPC